MKLKLLIIGLFLSFIACQNSNVDKKPDQDGIDNTLDEKSISSKDPNAPLPSQVDTNFLITIKNNEFWYKGKPYKGKFSV